MSESNATVININLNGGNQEKSQGHGQVIDCPVPWPTNHPFPFPLPFPYGPYNPMNDSMGSNAEQITENILCHGVKLALKLEINEEYDKAEMHKHIEKDVIPKITEAGSMNEVHAALEKVYIAYPGIKEFVHTAAQQYEIDEAGTSTLKKKKLPKWLRFVIKVVIFILKELLKD
jgi:hypothetical protein